MMLAAVAMTLTLHATVSPERTPQLIPVTVGISLVNRSRSQRTLEFPTAETFFIQVRDPSGKAIFDSRTGHKPIDVHGKFVALIGTTRVAAFVWNGLSDSMHAPLPGTYDVHVEMQSTSEHLVADAPLSIEPPLPVSAAVDSKGKTEMTIAGEPSRENGILYIGDSTGKIALSRALGLRPQGTFVVRGTPQDFLGRRTIFIDRFAPGGDNLESEATPTPQPSPAPTLPSPRRSG
ncbi:MAG: hypothetical protein ACRENA_10585 [Vulcanimicrobiaceae bacterium]